LYQTDLIIISVLHQVLTIFHALIHHPISTHDRIFALEHHLVVRPPVVEFIKIVLLPLLPTQHHIIVLLILRGVTLLDQVYLHVVVEPAPLVDFLVLEQHFLMHFAFLPNGHFVLNVGAIFLLLH